MGISRKQDVKASKGKDIVQLRGTGFLVAYQSFLLEDLSMTSKVKNVSGISKQPQGLCDRKVKP